MNVLIRTKDGREYVIETTHNTAEDFIRDITLNTFNDTWLNFGKKETCVYSGELLIKKDSIEAFYFNYRNSVTGVGYEHN